MYVPVQALARDATLKINLSPSDRLHDVPSSVGACTWQVL